MKSLTPRPMNTFFEELNSVQRVFDQLFNSPWGGTRPTEKNFLTPTCDVEETDKAYIFKFDLPGLKKDEIKIEVTDNQLLVSGERHEEKKEEKGSRRLSERYYGSFFRSFSLPTMVDSEKVAAVYNQGVLQVEIAKTTGTRNRTIDIKEAPAS